MGLFGKEYAYLFMKVSVENNRVSFLMDGYVKSKLHFIQSNGRMDIDTLRSIWDEGKKAFPRIASSAEEWVFFGEIANDAVTISETICREASGNGIWKRADPKDVMGNNPFKVKMSDLRKIHN